MFVRFTSVGNKFSLNVFSLYEAYVPKEASLIISHCVPHIAYNLPFFRRQSFGTCAWPEKNNNATNHRIHIPRIDDYNEINFIEKVVKALDK
jgi:hypothetical protein